MDLTPSDEQRLLRESADRFVAETYPRALVIHLNRQSSP